MSRFLGQINVKLTPGKWHDRPVWELLTPIYYDDGGPELIKLPAGISITNGADVPWMLTWLFPIITWSTFRPVILHDYLMRNRGGRTRARIDGALRHALKAEGNRAWRCWAMWAGVRTWAVLTQDK